jgi:hypothetical protein
LFARGIRALGIDNGAAKGDIKLASGGAMVGEIAARLSGGYMSGWTFPLSSGVEVTEAALRIAVGLPPGDLSPKRFHTSAERAFVSIPGTVAEICGLEEARGLVGVRELFLRIRRGQRVELPINNMGKCGNVIAAAASRNEAVAAAESAARCILVRLEAGNERTDRFLSGRLQEGFAAFPPGSAALERALSCLPDLVGPARAAGREGGGRAGTERAGGRTAGGGTAVTGPPVRILVPPEIDAEASRDWHGASLREALAAVCRHTGAEAVAAPVDGALCLGAAFWRGVLKGGAQAGVYLIDTLRGAGVAAGPAWRYLSRSR